MVSARTLVVRSTFAAGLQLVRCAGHWWSTDPAQLRDVESDRAKPRVVVRQLTIVSLAVLGIALVVGSGRYPPLTPKRDPGVGSSRVWC